MERDSNHDVALRRVHELLDRVAAIESDTDVSRLIGQFARLGISGPFSFYVMPDLRDPTVNALYIHQSGLTLPDRDYYLDDREERESIRQHMQIYAQQLAIAADRSHQSFRRAGMVLKFETELARIRAPVRDVRDIGKSYNPMTLDELTALNGDIEWQELFAAFGDSSIEKVVIGQPDYVRSMIGHMRTYIESITGDASQADQDDHRLLFYKAYFEHRVLHWAAQYLGDSFDDAYFEFCERRLLGKQEQTETWKRAVRLLNRQLGWAVSRRYCDRWYPKQAAHAVDDLVGNLKDAFRQTIENVSWLSTPAKKVALDKVTKMRDKIGKPQTWRTYDSVATDRNDLLANILACTVFETEWQLGKLQMSADRDEWMMTAHTVNAYYNSMLNEIVFPAAFLQPPLFDYRADPAYNYGAVGAIIGHEMSHGFDDQGRHFDAEGRLSGWWSDNELASFTERTQKLVEQFESFDVLDGHHLDGELTLGENIADLTGLTLAFRAYQISCSSDQDTIVDGMTGAQRFFVSWARIWRWKYRDEELMKMLKTDPHSPAEFRVNGTVANVPEFAQAFYVTSSDRLFRQDSDMARIW